MTAKICFFDIESSNLSANFGFMLSFGWKFQGEKTAKVISIADYPLYERDPTNDKELVKDAAEIISQADVVVGHFACYFDIPFINTRLLYHKLKPMPEVPLVDTWRICRGKLKLNSNRLDTISKFLEVKYEKTPVTGNHWVKAMAGNKKSLKYIIQHNKYDVLVLEEVYNRIRILWPNHPNVNIVTGKKDACPVCGVEGKLHSRGQTISKVTTTARYQCQACGTWSKGSPKRVKGLEVR